MPHVDPDLLATYMLGGDLPAAGRSHLADCPECRAEAAALGAVAASDRDRNSDGLVRPPSHVWRNIVAATGLGRTGPPRTGRGIRRLLAAAAAGLLAGMGVAVGWQAAGDGDGSSLVAEAVLEPQRERTAAGQAVLVQAESQRRLMVSVDLPGTVDGYLAVWLLTPDLSGLVSLGALTEGAAELVIPSGLDLDRYPVVDVSVEPFDGNPAHSGDSLVRGQLGDT